MEEIKPIETEYKGYLFRSILETMWAAFFDHLNIKWEYEPQTFKLANGMKYLPDFKLFNFVTRCGGEKEKGEVLWAEVKGVKDKQDLEKRKPRDIQKVYAFSTLSSGAHSPVSHNPTIILPSIPPAISGWSIGGWINTSVTSFEYIDGNSRPCFITKDNLSDDYFILCGDYPGYCSKQNIELTENALAAAQAQRVCRKRVS